MTSSNPQVIAYGYELAPNPQKLFQFLAFFSIPYSYVEIPPIMPRPMLANLDITYRRAPLLSIGGDVYIDNALIIEKLSAMASATLQNGLADNTNHVEYDGLGQLAFQCAVGLIPQDIFFLQDQAFLDDRSELMGFPFQPSRLIAGRAGAITKMTGLCNLVTTHFLRDGRRFFLGGSHPSTADMHLYWGLNWGLRWHEGARPEISESTHPAVFEWLHAVEEFITPRKRETKIDMAQAEKVLLGERPSEFVPHIGDNPEKLEQGSHVSVTPVDTGKNHPQRGTLVSVNFEQVVVKNEKGIFIHFPRMGYDVVAVPPPADAAGS